MNLNRIFEILIYIIVLHQMPMEMQMGMRLQVYNRKEGFTFKFSFWLAVLGLKLDYVIYLHIHYKI